MNNEEVCLKPNAKIKTNEFGEIERKIYKSLVESYTLLNLALNELKMQNIPIEVSITTTDTGFFKDFLNRKENNIGNNILTDEQLFFESDKKLHLEKVVLNRVYATLNR